MVGNRTHCERCVVSIPANRPIHFEPQYKYEISRGVEPSHMDKYTFIDRYFHSQRELLDIRHSEERDNIAVLLTGDILI
ncbi:hypothetical protein Pcaca04_13580 [Pectobacterium carotovorum subsp. carotovorum]|nr:hypothetical protein Pcaca04_13580 [Pectobacterium carotovorum subsp. carotovorum]